MEKNNDPSTGSGTNKNPNVEELSDEQLNKVAGGITEVMFMGACNVFSSSGCQNYDVKQCKCLD